MWNSVQLRSLYDDTLAAAKDSLQAVTDAIHNGYSCGEIHKLLDEAASAVTRAEAFSIVLSDPAKTYYVKYHRCHKLVVEYNRLHRWFTSYCVRR